MADGLFCFNSRSDSEYNSAEEVFKYIITPTRVFCLSTGERKQNLKPTRCDHETVVDCFHFKSIKILQDAINRIMHCS